MKDSLRKLLRGRNCAILAVVVIVWKHDVIIGTFFDQMPGFEYPFDDRKFDAKIWRAGDPEIGKCSLGTMADDLIQNYLKVGMTRKDVERLIGKPTEPKPLSNFDPKSPQGENSVDIYELGSCSGFQMDMDLLAIRYDQSNRVVLAWHYQS